MCETAISSKEKVQLKTQIASVHYRICDEAQKLKEVSIQKDYKHYEFSVAV